MIFLDTSAIYALADRKDPRHRTATRGFEHLLEIGEGLLTHNYVLVESVALIQNRLGLDPALTLARSARSFDVHWVDRAIHDEALARLTAGRKRGVSLVDHVSFVVMRSLGVTTAFAFDPDFAREGFTLYVGPSGD